jgi:hypothetical protein
MERKRERVCVREREGGREGGRERERGRERGVWKLAECVVSFSRHTKLH